MSPSNWARCAAASVPMTMRAPAWAVFEICCQIGADGGADVDALGHDLRRHVLTQIESFGGHPRALFDGVHIGCDGSGDSVGPMSMRRDGESRVVRFIDPARAVLRR